MLFISRFWNIWQILMMIPDTKKDNRYCSIAEIQPLLSLPVINCTLLRSVMLFSVCLAVLAFFSSLDLGVKLCFMCR